MRFNNGRTLETHERPKHVIEEYRHRAQRVTCVCGWEGSTESVLGAPSAWALHVRESKLGEAKTGTTD
jgi:hypothetical protein